MIRFRCPHCRKLYSTSDDSSGKSVVCRCGQRVKISAASEPTATDIVVALEHAAEYEDRAASVRVTPTDEGRASASSTEVGSQAVPTHPPTEPTDSPEAIDGELRSITIVFLPGVVIAFSGALALSFLSIPYVLSLISVSAWMRFVFFGWIGVLMPIGAALFLTILTISAVRGVSGKGVVPGFLEKGCEVFDTVRWTFLVGYSVYTIVVTALSGWLTYQIIRPHGVRDSDILRGILAAVCGFVILCIVALLGRRLYRRWIDPPEEPTSGIAGTRYGRR